VSGYFRFGRAGGESSDPWFRIGTLDVGTTMLIVLLSVVSLVVFALEPVDKPIQTALAMISTDVAHGQLWRLVTWPFANLYVSFWVAVNIFFFWYFGSEIERSIGRVKMAILFFGTAILSGVAGTVIDLAMAGTFYGGGMAGLGTLGLLMALVFIAENPHIRFFFGIPGWVIGAILVGIQVIQLLGYRYLVDLFTFLASLVVVAVMARSVGLLAERSWVPSIPVPSFRARRRSRRSRKSARPTGPTVVAGPWEPPPAAPVSPDQAALDALLDKISAQGMDSLSDQEREQLLVLRDRLRRRSGGG
jgi:membrane associated rhomboid family serine protease